MTVSTLVASRHESRRFRQQEQYEQAAEKYQQAIDIDPEFPDAHNSFGQVRAAQERFDEAIEEYRQADALWQKEESNARKRVLLSWASALFMQKQHEAVIEKCRQAVSIDRHDPQSRWLFGVLLAGQE